MATNACRHSFPLWFTVSIGVESIVPNAYLPALVSRNAPMPVEVPEIIESDSTRVACDGGNGVLGHPKVYLEMGDQTYVECPYCDRRFVLREGARAH
jgi:uncharacterized Zn-finger protein